MKSRSQSQLNLPPSLVNKVEDAGPVLKKVENDAVADARAASGALIDKARELAGLTRQEACALMFISEQQYSRWISGAANDTASHARLLLLTPDFWFEMNLLITERYRLRRRYVERAVSATTDLALVTGDCR